MEDLNSIGFSGAAQVCFRLTKRTTTQSSVTANRKNFSILIRPFQTRVHNNVLGLIATLITCLVPGLASPPPPAKSVEPRSLAHCVG